MLLARIYESAPLACPQCGSDMRIIAFVTDGVSVRGILEHIGEPADPPRIAPARPTWRFFAKYRVCVSSESPLRLSLLRSCGQVLSRFRDLMAQIEVVSASNGYISYPFSISISIATNFAFP